MFHRIHQISNDEILSLSQNPIFTKVLFTRDPFERLVSAYMDKFVHTYEPPYADDAVMIIKKYRNFPNDVMPAWIQRYKFDQDTLQDIRDPLTFQEFLQFILDGNKLHLSTHWDPISDMCLVCKIQYNYIIKYETINEDMLCLLTNILCSDGRKCNLSLETAYFTKKNETKIINQSILSAIRILKKSENCGNPRSFKCFHLQDIDSLLMHLEATSKTASDVNHNESVLQFLSVNGIKFPLRSSYYFRKPTKHFVSDYLKNLTLDETVGLWNLFAKDAHLFDYRLPTSGHEELETFKQYASIY